MWTKWQNPWRFQGPLFQQDNAHLFIASRSIDLLWRISGSFYHRAWLGLYGEKTEKPTASSSDAPSSSASSSKLFESQCRKWKRPSARIDATKSREMCILLHLQPIIQKEIVYNLFFSSKMWWSLLKYFLGVTISMSQIIYSIIWKLVLA